MLAYTPGLAAAIESNSYDLAAVPARIQVTLPGGIYPDVSLVVESLDINASTTTDLPDDVRLAAGYPAVTCDFTLSGTVDLTTTPHLTAAGLFGQYQTASPLYRKSVLGSNVTVDIGIVGTDGPFTFLRKFTGTIDSFTVDPVSGAVSFTCIDYRQKLRSIPSIPAVVTAPPYNAGLTSEFAVDAILRAATNGAYSSWPAQRANCVLAAGMRSSVWPEVGTLVSNFYGSISVPPVFGAGAFGTGLASVVPNARGTQAIVYQFTHNETGHFFIEYWVNRQAGDYSKTPFAAMFGDDGFLNIYVLGPANDRGFAQGVTLQWTDTFGTQTGVATWATTISNGPHYISVEVTSAVGSTTWSAIITLDGVTHSTGSLTLSTARTNGFNSTVVGVETAPFSASAWGTLEALQVTTEAVPGSNYGFVPQAVLDPSLNTLQAVPAVSGDPWQVLQQIADAELAVAGFDESTGIFKFTNRNTLRSSSVQRTITSSTSLKNLQIASSAAALADQVTVGYTPWTFGAGTSVFQSASAWRVAAHKVQSWTVGTTQLVASIDPGAINLVNGHSTTTGASYFRASMDSAGLNEHPGVSTGALVVTVAEVSSSQVTITAANHTSYDAWFVSPANYTDIPVGTPSVWVGAVPATQGNEVTVGQALNSNPQTTVSITGNPWLQDDASARQLAFDLLDELSSVRPDLTGIDIVPDPRLQLMDRVLISDPDTSGVVEYAVIWGWTLSLSGSDWSQTVDARTVTGPGQWILGLTGRTELGVATYI